jgi:hypothetical protein
MSTPNQPPPESEPKAPASTGPLARVLDWKKDKKRVILIGTGAVLAIVIVVSLTGGGASNGYSETLMKSDPARQLSQMAAKLRPDLEIVSVDAVSHVVTLKDKNGVRSTLVFDPSTKTLVPGPPPAPEKKQEPAPAEKQETAPDTAGLPAWAPVYPATTPQITSSAVTTEGDQQIVAVFKSGDAPLKVIEFYRSKLQENSFSIKASSSGEQTGMIQAEDAEKKRSLILNVSTTEGSTQARIVTVQKK